MGVFIANIAYALAGSSKHKVTLPIGCAVSIAIFLIAQIFVEHVFNYKTSVSNLSILVCGIYFLALTVRTRGITLLPLVTSIKVMVKKPCYLMSLWRFQRGVSPH